LRVINLAALKNMRVLASLALGAVSAAGIAVAYYFGFVLPHVRESERVDAINEKQEARTLEASRRCKDDGERFYADLRRQGDNDALWDPPEFHFSVKLNTCLVHTRYVVPVYESVSNQYNELWDIYSNKHLFYGCVKRDASTKPWKEELLEMLDDKPNYTTTKFFEEKAKIFNEESRH
jgi:hypothetical protein